jgi:hypothetical protein
VISIARTVAQITDKFGATRPTTYRHVAKLPAIPTASKGPLTPNENQAVTLRREISSAEYRREARRHQEEFDSYHED